jgi:hypothetical protein
MAVKDDIVFIGRKRMSLYRYLSYNLAIQSVFPIPEMQHQPRHDVEADVVIRVDNVRLPLTKSENVEHYFSPAGDEAYFFFEMVGRFLVRNGNEIIVDPIIGSGEELVTLPLLGAIMAVLLHQRGFFVLHASAVAINGQAVAFVGTKGQGKSTMAATLFERGHSLLADDVVALDLNDPAHPMVLPGHLQMKLWPEAVNALGIAPELVPPLALGFTKGSYLVPSRFGGQSLPLARLYSLGLGSSLEITPMPTQQALLQIITHSYIARWGHQLLNNKAASMHFTRCKDLISQVPFLYLNRERCLESLPRVASLVENDVS